MGGVGVKRDLELVREILIEVENVAGGGPKSFDASKVDIIKFRHVELLKMAGLLDSNKFNETASKLKVQLTWDGHDFLDAIKDQSIWNKTKAKLKEVGGTAPFDIVKSVASGVIQAVILGSAS